MKNFFQHSLSFAGNRLWFLTTTHLPATTVASVLFVQRFSFTYALCPCVFMPLCVFLVFSARTTAHLYHFVCLCIQLFLIVFIYWSSPLVFIELLISSRAWADTGSHGHGHGHGHGHSHGIFVLAGSPFNFIIQANFDKHCQLPTPSLQCSSYSHIFRPCLLSPQTQGGKHEKLIDKY